MAKSFICVGFLFSCVVMLAVLDGCHSPNAPRKSEPADQASMQQMLKGTWILQEYEDSIDAGLTPKLLEYMFSKYNLMACDFDSGDYRILSYTPRMGNYYMDPLYDTCRIRFMPGSNKMVFEINYFDVQRRTASIDTAELIINGPDTILRFYDSIATALDLVKYDNSKCPNADVYQHLISSKFIAGKYFRVDDDQHEHHIIFTRCGDVEGAQNIDASMNDFATYSVVYSGFGIKMPHMLKPTCSHG